MTLRDLRDINTTRNSCRDAFLCENMTLKLHQYFYLLMEKPLGPLLAGLVSLLSGRTVQPENIYSCILKVTGQVLESQKRTSTLITATTSLHPPKPVSTDLRKPGSVLTNPIGKDGVWSWSMENIYSIKHLKTSTS